MWNGNYIIYEELYLRMYTIFSKLTVLCMHCIWIKLEEKKKEHGNKTTEKIKKKECIQFFK